MTFSNYLPVWSLRKAERCHRVIPRPGWSCESTESRRRKAVAIKVKGQQRAKTSLIKVIHNPATRINRKKDNNVNKSSY